MPLIAAGMDMERATRQPTGAMETKSPPSTRVDYPRMCEPKWRRGPGGIRSLGGRRPLEVL